MKLLKIAFTLATLATCYSALAGTDVAFQEVLDRNANPYYAKPDYHNRVFFSGLLKGMAGLRTATTRDGATDHPLGTDLVLPRANLYIDAVVNDFTMAHMALSFHRLRDNFADNKGALTFDETQGNGMYTRAGIFTAYDGLSYRPYQYVDEAFVTIGNLHHHPAYFRMGIGRVDFGLYDRNEILINWTTLFTETQATFAKLGFMDASGFFGSVYAFRGLAKASDISRKDVDIDGNPTIDGTDDGFPHINNGGVSVGYCMNHGHSGVKFVVDWMYNIIGGVNVFRTLTTGTYVNVEATDGTTTRVYSVYSKRIMGLHVGMKAHYNQFDFRGNFMTAMKEFDETEAVLANKKPMVWSVGTGVHFKVGYRPSRLGVGWQMTHNLKDAANKPTATTAATGWLKGIVNQGRFHADWTTEMLKNVTAGLHYSFEHPYNDTLERGVKVNQTHTFLISLTTKIV